MFRIAASALALASMSLIAAAPAQAAAKCACAKKAKHSSNRSKTHPRKTSPASREAAVVTPAPKQIQHINAVVEPDTYISPESRYLPDPIHNDRPMWAAAGGEIAIATALNASLDLWRTCAWRGQEAAAAEFVSWSRTHSVGGAPHASAEGIQPAWKAFGKASAQRVSYDTNKPFNTQPPECNITAGELMALKADMERQAQALSKAHALGHRKDI